MDKVWYYTKGTDEHFGPYTEDELIRLLEKRILKEDDYIWMSAMEDWVRVGDSIYSFYLGDSPEQNLI